MRSVSFLAWLLSLALTLTPVGGETSGSSIRKDPWEEHLRQQTIYSLEHPLIYWSAGERVVLDSQYPDLTVQDGALYMTSHTVEATFSLTRLWNSEDPDQIRFSGSGGFTDSLMILMRIGETSCIVSGVEVGPIPAPYISLNHQRIPVAALCIALGFEMVERDGLLEFGPSAKALEQADGEQVAKLKAWLRDTSIPVYNSSAQLLRDEENRAYIIAGNKISDGRTSHSLPDECIVHYIQEGYLYLYQISSQCYMRLELASGQVETLFTRSPEMQSSREPALARKVDSGYLVAQYYGGPTMGGTSVFFVDEQGVAKLLVSGKISDFLSLHGDRLYYLGGFLMPIGHSNNLSVHSLSTEEATDLFQNGKVYGHGFFELKAHFAYGSTNAVFLPDSRLLTTVAEAPLLDANIDSLGGQLCLLDLTTEQEMILTPEYRVLDFRLFNKTIVFVEAETGRLGLAYLLNPEDAEARTAAPRLLSETSVQQFDLVGDTLYYLDHENHLFSIELSAGTIPRRIIDQEVASFKALDDGIVVYTKKLLSVPEVYRIDAEGSHVVHQGYVQDYGVLTDGRIVVVPATADGSCLIY